MDPAAYEPTQNTCLLSAALTELLMARENLAQTGLPGTSAVFVGMEEQHYAVLCRQQAILYSSTAGFQEPRPSRSSRIKGPEPQALKKITLAGTPYALFPGPAWSQLPRRALSFT